MSGGAEDPDAARRILNGAERFDAAGGTIKPLGFRKEEVDNFNAGMRTVKAAAIADGTERAKMGVALTGLAVHSPNGVVAYNKDGIVAGAIGFKNHRSGVHIDYLGSTFIEKGTGSALTRHAFKKAAAEGKGISLKAKTDAKPFWKKMGFEFGSSGRTSMPAERVAEIARAL